MGAISGVAVAKISEITDPQSKGRVQISLPNQTSLGTLWAPVATAVGRGEQLEEGDEGLVAFESGDPRRPFVIGLLQQRTSPPPEQAGTTTVHLPGGRALHPIQSGSGTGGSSICATTADLQRQTAPWLASTECLLRVLALLKPLIDIVKTLPSPPPASLTEFAKAAVALQPF